MEFTLQNVVGTKWKKNDGLTVCIIAYAHLSADGTESLFVTIGDRTIGISILLSEYTRVAA